MVIGFYKVSVAVQIFGSISTFATAATMNSLFLTTYEIYSNSYMTCIMSILFIVAQIFAITAEPVSRLLNLPIPICIFAGVNLASALITAKFMKVKS